VAVRADDLAAVAADGAERLRAARLAGQHEQVLLGAGPAVRGEGAAEGRGLDLAQRRGRVAARAAEGALLDAAEADVDTAARLLPPVVVQRGDGGVDRRAVERGDRVVGRGGGGMRPW
jgi:hypothetical protein